MAAVSGVLIGAAGCQDPSPQVVQPSTEYSFEAMNEMAASDTAVSEEGDQ